jgi:hypothetical protein
MAPIPHSKMSARFDDPSLRRQFQEGVLKNRLPRKGILSQHEFKTGQT